MLILGISTATASLSAALWRDGQLLSEMTVLFGRPHAETLLPLVEDLLRDQGVPVSAIDVYACAAGPGSYTGIRIGISVIKGMAYAAGKPAVGISTLRALAWPYASDPGLITCPVLDARNQRIYAAAWRGVECLVPEKNWAASDFLAQVGQIPPEYADFLPNRVLFIGDFPAGPASINRAPAACSMPRASYIAELAEQKILAGFSAAAQDLTPSYLSLSQAERLLGSDNA
jgi:tRNA threonylcarbamoyladenosine biosynthesis protein TsaB